MGSETTQIGSRSRNYSFLLLALLATQLWLCRPLLAQPAFMIDEESLPETIGVFQKLEINFLIRDSVATRYQWPYDPDPPRGVEPATGVSVDGVFLDPDGMEYRQPAFYCQKFLDKVESGREWHYPTQSFSWMVRFSPNRTGTWSYRLEVRDHSGGTETRDYPLEVVPSDSRGFVRVSKEDSRYFEFDDGSFFPGLGINLAPPLAQPAVKGREQFKRLAESGITFLRMWISSIYGSAWNPYVGSRNQYRGYLPITGLVPFTDKESGQTTLTMRIDYELAGDTKWFDGCRTVWSDAPEAVKPQTTYRISVKYRGIGIEGPRVPGNYGFVVKEGKPGANCCDAGSGVPLTNYGRNNATWGYIQGSWNSGNRSFLPRLYLALENATKGGVHVQEISLREDLGGGRLGPEIMTKPSMEHHLYIPEKEAYAFDKIVQLAERYGILLKLVIMEQNDKIYQKLDDDGDFVSQQDNADGFYGTGREVNKTRWLQRMWWRYLQARWGYSPSIHSWELTNEGDPEAKIHYELADEFAKFMHYGVFGVDFSECDELPDYNHPNDHLVTTSFWHSFPSSEFWSNREYSNLDYADLHAYVSTSTAPDSEKRKMIGDAAWYHIWHSQYTAKFASGKPVVRGEAGLDVPGQQNETVLGLQRDKTGVWLHNFLWAGLDSGSLYELYWWNSHIANRRADHRHLYKSIHSFLSQLDLNRGGYSDWDGTVSNPGLRVVGQKNVQAGKMHLWIQNRLHTWRNVSRGSVVEPETGELTVPGFDPTTTYEIQWWDTWADERRKLFDEKITADEQGVLMLRVEALTRDVAVTVRIIESS